MLPQQFIRKWGASTLKERSAAHEHFIDLCRMLGEKTPAEADPEGIWYCFEKGARKTTGGDGWADVWRRGCFGWEYKGKRLNLEDALIQLRRYAPALENPPLLIVSDTGSIRIHTNFTNSVHQVHTIDLADLEQPGPRQLLKWVFVDPERLRPDTTREAVTEKAAGEFAGLAQRLRDRGHEPLLVAHFINRLLFCLFAEDIGLLPNFALTRLLQVSLDYPGHFEAMARQLFAAMRSGGVFGPEYIEWFNGGLFDDDAALPLDKGDIAQLLRAAKLDWSDLEPSIFGTLFERGLDPGKRSQLGAHYTDRNKIMKIVEPVVLAPLRAEWEETKKSVTAVLARSEASRHLGSQHPKWREAQTRAHSQANKMCTQFLERLRSFRVLDPACGSGNFLYLALMGLKDLEHAVNLDIEMLGLERRFPTVGPENVCGIEINPYAAELARATVWIGEIQWMKRNGFGISARPILKPLDNIECRDALLNHDGSEASWPAADVIIGNPPFLGGQMMIGDLGTEYSSRLRAAFARRVPRGADLVCYWFEKARAFIRAGTVARTGLVATNSIRGGANRAVIDGITQEQTIFDAWSDEPWILEGASVRVSLICFGRLGKHASDEARLNGHLAGRIFSDLSAGGIDLTKSRALVDNAGYSFQGPVLVGPFDIPGDKAREWLLLPLNLNGRSNADVLGPLSNGRDIASRSRRLWVIDFGRLSCAEACLYEAPFEYVRATVKPIRDSNAEAWRRVNWWLHGRTGDEFRKAILSLSRYVATSQVSRHRFFVWLHPRMRPHQTVIAVARDDDMTFGILHSRLHQLWGLRLGTSLEDRPRYTPSTTFETFPFPEGLTPNIPAEACADDPRAQRIAAGAKRLNELREAWLNPPDLVVRVPEVVPGYPDRILPKDDEAASILKKRTLTNLYNQRPAWLDHIHRELDEAVAAAYGWPADLSDEEILARLFALNQERAGAVARVSMRGVDTSAGATG
jgi:type II restriction/modification system DNA methylase subunit YeeA